MGNELRHPVHCPKCGQTYYVGTSEICSEVKAERDSLRAELDDLKAFSAGQQEACDRLRAARNDHAERAERAEAEADRLRSGVADLERERDENTIYAGELSDARADVEKFRRQAAEYDKNATAAWRQVEQAEAEAKRLRAANPVLLNAKADLAAAEKAIQQAHERNKLAFIQRRDLIRARVEAIEAALTRSPTEKEKEDD